MAETQRHKRSKTNFEIDLEEMMRDPEFAERFEAAGDAWDLAIQVYDLREKAGLTQA